VAGIQNFKRIFIWLVGNGDSINIWKEPWIPRSPDRKVTTPRGPAIYTKVNELIYPLSGHSDQGLLATLFSSLDVRGIMQIPLNCNNFDDLFPVMETALEFFRAVSLSY
jgi:hypothetical protein